MINQSILKGKEGLAFSLSKSFFFSASLGHVRLCSLYLFLFAPYISFSSFTLLENIFLGSSFDFILVSVLYFPTIMRDPSLIRSASCRVCIYCLSVSCSGCKHVGDLVTLQETSGYIASEYVFFA